MFGYLHSAPFTIVVEIVFAKLQIQLSESHVRVNKIKINYVVIRKLSKPKIASKTGVNGDK